MTQHNLIHIDKNWGLFIGQFSDNLKHKHIAIQLSIGLDSELTLIDDAGMHNANNFVVNSNIEHQLSCGGNHLTLLINPSSTWGHFFREILIHVVDLANETLVINLKEIGVNFINGIIDSETLVKQLKSEFNAFQCHCDNNNHFSDDRILKTLTYLDENYDVIISAKEMAEYCFLSESRFLHLFKEKTGVTYRKAQQWNKVSKSFNSLFKQNLTQTAHEFGFTDSAHYTKVVKATFGFNPKVIQNL